MRFVFTIPCQVRVEDDPTTLVGKTESALTKEIHSTPQHLEVIVNAQDLENATFKLQRALQGVLRQDYRLFYTNDR